MYPLSKNIFELVFLLEGAWKFRWTLQVKTFFNNISLNVKGYLEISMDPFGKEFLNQSQCYRVHGNMHGPFR